MADLNSNIDWFDPVTDDDSLEDFCFLAPLTMPTFQLETDLFEELPANAGNESEEEANADIAVADDGKQHDTSETTPDIQEAEFPAPNTETESTPDIREAEFPAPNTETESTPDIQEAEFPAPNTETESLPTGFTDDVTYETMNDMDSDHDLMEALEAIESQSTVTTINNETTSRFAVLDETERDQILDEANSKGTKKMTKYGVKMFKQWLGERNKDVNFEEYSIITLNSTLKEFYAEVRNTEGQLYSKSTYVGIRASISRYLRAAPYNKCFSVLTDKEFHTANQMFLAMLRKLKREGLDRAKHHPSISEVDLEKLRASNVMATNDPKSLQRKVWFDLMLSFGRRGRENQRNFTDTTFEFLTDDRGHEYVEMASSEVTKNHPGGLNDDDYETKPHMYSTGKPDCPVAALRKYLGKRCPKTSHFFQQPRVKVQQSDVMWYTSRPVGEKKLNNMMKSISNDAGLSKLYTNHCVRATTVSVLAHAGIPNREIMKITGHKCEGSLDSYNADSSDKQKRKYSSILQGQNEAPAVPVLPVRNHENESRAMPTPAMAHTPNPFNNMQLNMSSTNINNQIALPTMFQKQFEVNNSTVQVFNYFHH